MVLHRDAFIEPTRVPIDRSDRDVLVTIENTLTKILAELTIFLHALYFLALVAILVVAILIAGGTILLGASR